MAYILITHTKIIGDKRIMLNATSKPSQVMKEINEDWERAERWFVKKMGGSEKLKDYTQRLIQEAIKTKIDQCSEPIPWLSMKYNNKWYMFLVVKYYKKVDFAYPHLMGFCYYKTAASIGAFMPAAGAAPDGSTDRGFALHYTDHFFLRLADRAGIKADTPENVKGFIQFIHNSQVMINPDGESKHGNDADIIVKLPGSYGFGGINEEGSDTLFTINSFLLAKSLTRKQKKLVKRLDEFADMAKYTPEELQRYYMLKNSYEGNEDIVMAEAERMKDMQIKSGIPKWYIDNIEAMMTVMGVAALKLGFFKARQFLKMQQFGLASKDIIHKVVASPDYENINQIDMLFIFREMVIAAGYGDKFDLKAAAKYFLTMGDTMTEDEFEKTWGEHPILKYKPKVLNYDPKDARLSLEAK